MLNKSYGLVFLKYAMPYLSAEDFSSILATAWVMCEAPHNDSVVNKGDLILMFKSANPAVLMDEDEYEEFKTLDDKVTVYRGVTSYNSKNIKALSWTLDQEVAKWFAHRFDEDGVIYEAQIDKKYIYALFKDRGESEVIVDPKYLTNIIECEDMNYNPILSQ